MSKTEKSGNAGDSSKRMLDPGLEHMHRHGRLWRASTERRRLLTEAVTDSALLVPIIGLLVFAPGGGWAPTWEVVLLVGAVAVTSLVRFEIGSGSMSPMQLILVPLWFAIPPAFLPIMYGLGLILGGAIERLREDGGQPVWRSIFHAGDAWPAVGPAIVFAVAGSPEAASDSVWLVAAAFGAQLAVDLGLGIGSTWVVHRVHPAIQLRLQSWVAMVDASMVPIGFLTAVVMTEHPVALVALLPMVAVIGEFARERQDRLEQALQLSSAYRGTAQLMGDVLEADDAYTGGEHTQGVVEMAIAVGLELRLTPRAMRDLEFGALLHDIGKLQVPNEIINKPGSLDSAEWEIIRRHPIYGQEMLDRVGGAMTDAGRIVRAHHERWDGLGYPDQLRADEIPTAARIITVCDSFSAMTTTRSYSAAMTHEAAIAELGRCSGTQFDPTVVDALFQVLERNPRLAAGGAHTLSPGMSAAGAALRLRPIAWNSAGAD